MTPPSSRRRPAAQILADVYADVVAACDGAALVHAALIHGSAAADLAALGVPGAPLHIVALGKVALPMLQGLGSACASTRQDRAAAPARFGQGLVVTTAAQAARAPTLTFSGFGPPAPGLPAEISLVTGEHPTPGPGSLHAGQAVLDFVSQRPPGEPLVVLLSGGGSALACLPSPPLALADKVTALALVANAGASIHELNTVRKHLSVIKGGRLATVARGPILVIALCDVIGGDPSVIASGPFCPDPTTFAEAAAILNRLAPQAPAAVHAHLRAGAGAETCKPGGMPTRGRTFAPPHHLCGGPDHVRTAAWAAAKARGLVPMAGQENTELSVQSLAAIYEARALTTTSPVSCIVIGNGEPRVTIPADRPAGRGGRASHLALLMAKALQGRNDVAFLAAGTDDRDGSSDATGAVVDGQTWREAVARGLDPQGALDGHDSATLLARLGAGVRGPARSNLLDVHLLACGAAAQGGTGGAPRTQPG